MMDRQTPLLGTGRYSAADISRAFDHYGNDPGNIGAVIVDAAGAIGLNGDFLACQIADETGWWTSQYATERNNPSGFGAVDGNPDLAYTFDSVAAGIRATVAHWGSYILGDSNPLLREDSRARLIRPGWYGRIKTLGQIGSGVWASSNEYAQAILNRDAELEQIAGDQSPQRTGGSMEPDKQYSVDPPVQLQLQNDAHSFRDRPTNPDGRILAIVKHVTDGDTLAGALSWNRRPDVQAAAHFYIDKDGSVVQDVSLYNGAWANGVLANDTLPSQFDEVKRNGWNPNDFTISIEHVGMPDDADFPTDAQVRSSDRLTADLCDFYHIPVDEDHIIGHYRFDGVNRANCPGPHWDFTADVRRVSDLLNGGADDGTHGHSPNGGTNPTGGGQSDNGTGQMAGTVDAAGTGGDGRVTRDGHGNVRFVRFNTTGHLIGGGFLQHYRSTGFDNDPESALDVSSRYGFPVTGEYTVTLPTIRGGQPTVIQWFERARFEWVVDNPETGEGHVELGRVGVEAMEALPPASIPGDAWRG